MTLFKNEIEKAWCHSFENEYGEGDKNIRSPKHDRNIEISVYTAKSEEYSDTEIALNKVQEVNPMDRPKFLFNISKYFKVAKSDEQLNELLTKSVKMEFITNPQKDEILRIIS